MRKAMRALLQQEAEEEAESASPAEDHRRDLRERLHALLLRSELVP